METLRRNRIVFSTIRAGALYYVIGMAAVIALLLGSFLTMNRLQQLFLTRSYDFKEIVYTNQQVFRYLEELSIDYNQPSLLYHPTNPDLQTTLLKKHWGIFDVLLSTSQLRKEHFKSVSLLGSGQQHRSALYLSDHKKPLVVVGSTRIEGQAILPEKGIKRGTIAGRNYYEQDVLFGVHANSQPYLPKLRNRAYLQRIDTELLSEEMRYKTWGTEPVETHSFWQPTHLFYAAEGLDLKHVSLQGNIIVQSATQIRVFNSCHLKDLLLIAPSIEIMEGVKGNFQAIASRALRVGKNCELKYPSAMVLCETTRANETPPVNLPNMHVDEGTRIQGVLAYISDASQRVHKAEMKLQKNVLLEGELYCEKNLDSEATIHGTVYADAFVAEQFGSVYQNHLYNCRINSYLLPPEYSGLFIEDQPVNLVKWLY